MRATWGMLALAALAAGCGGGEERRRPDVLLITIDTLRADHLGAYGATHGRTPGLDRFAADSTVFERAAAPMPLTRPSHFTILTSLYPREHGVLNNRIALPQGSPVLPQTLGEHGYRTAAFVAVALLGPESGADRGFGYFDYPTEDRQRPAEEVVTKALAWLDGVPPEESFFLWVHLFDPHEPYGPPPEFRGAPDEELWRAHPSVGWEELLRIAEANEGHISAAILEHVKGLYEGEVAYTDHWVGRLIDGVDARRDKRDTLVVFTADHGECFENGWYFEHADCMFEPALRVPLIVRRPGSFPAGARNRGQVSLVDVAPTILRAVGLEAGGAMSGRPLTAEAPGDDRYVLVQYPFYQEGVTTGKLPKREVVRTVAGQPLREMLVGVEQAGVVGADWKYLRTTSVDGSTEELYRMAPAPDEVRDLAPESGDALPALRERLDHALDAHRLNLLAPQQVNQELLEMLKSLGYVGS
jgi:arylsulfatase A-like enzyme